MPPSPAAAVQPPPRWLQLVATGCVGLLLLGGIAGAVVYLAVARATEEPEAVVEEFLAAAAAEEWERAYGTFAPGLQQVQGFADFEAAASANAHLFEVREMRFTSREVSGEGVTLAGSLRLASGEEVPASFGLVPGEQGYLLISYTIGE